MGNRKQPEVRFKGFTEEWEEHKAGNIFLSKSDKNYPNLPVLSASQEKGMILRKDIGIDIKYDRKSLSNYKRVKPEQFVIHLRSFQGGFAYSQIEGITSPAYTILSFKEKDENFPLFWKQTLTSPNFIKRLEKVTYGIRDGRSISYADFSLIKFLVPSFGEQNRIGKLLSRIDDKIALQERQIELLKEQKKGFLQKMFPKKGEKTPEVRFAGYVEDWEKRKLGEISDIVGGGTPSTSQQNYWDGEIDWYSPAEIGEHIYMFGSKKRITELGLKKSSAKVHPIGTVLFTSRAGIGKTAILKKEGSTNQGFQSILPKKNILDSYFIFSRTKELKRYGEVTGAGSTFIEVSGKQMEKMVLKIPSYIEQVDLGKFFKKLDDNIALNQKELKILKQIKKGLLKKMFV